MSAGVKENDRIVGDFGLEVFGHAADVDQTRGRIVVTVFLHRKATARESGVN